MGGFHFIDLIVILAIGLLIAGPKALQSMSRNAGKGMGQAKNMKDKVMSELPVEERKKRILLLPLSSEAAGLFLDQRHRVTGYALLAPGETESVGCSCLYTRLFYM